MNQLSGYSLSFYIFNGLFLFNNNNNNGDNINKFPCDRK